MRCHIECRVHKHARLIERALVSLLPFLPSGRILEQSY
jgi:hypothetical protein